MIELNKQQQLAVKLGSSWFETLPKQVFEIAGYAGTGKTTIVNAIIEECGLSLEEVLFTAYVGKAAMVLSMKGIPAKTIHSTFYNVIDVPKEDENGDIVVKDGHVVMTKRFVKKRRLDKKIRLIVVDEASMINSELKKDILSFNIPTIVLGDLHQLPPVFGDPVFLVKPDVTLTEIMRQQEGNPIIHLATMARERKWNEFYKFGAIGTGALICKKNDLIRYDSLLRNANIIICAKNRTREDLNQYVRKEIYGILPEHVTNGDKLICRRNNWGETIGDDIFLVNGMIGFVRDINFETYNKNSIEIEFSPEFMPDRSFKNLVVDFNYFTTPYGLKKNYFSRYNLFDFGYAVTAHLSQGSQYDKVVVYNERMGDDEFYSKWLYTAITRAIHKIVIAM